MTRCQRLTLPSLVSQPLNRLSFRRRLQFSTSNASLLAIRLLPTHGFMQVTANERNYSVLVDYCEKSMACLMNAEKTSIYDRIMRKPCCGHGPLWVDSGHYTPDRNGSKVHILPIQTSCSECQHIPNRSLVTSAAKVWREPEADYSLAYIELDNRARKLTP